MKSESSSTVNSRIAQGNLDRRDIRSSGEHSDESLVERLCQELEGQADMEHVRQVLQEAYESYQDATVRAYQPVLVQRFVL